MKKHITIIALSILILLTQTAFSSINKTHASAVYQRVITEDTPFYKNVTDVSPLFYLPYTYYVKVLSENNGFMHVECYGTNGSPALDGYVPSGVLFNDGLTVINPYLTLTVTTAKTAVLYEDSSLTNAVQYLFSDRELQYLGAYPTPQGNIYYVGYNGRLGYVKEEAVIPFTITNHPNELTFITPEEPPEEPPVKDDETPIAEDYFEIKIIIIACLIFAGLIALFIALKQKPKTNTAASYYDENDYE